MDGVSDGFLERGGGGGGAGPRPALTETGLRDGISALRSDRGLLGRIGGGVLLLPTVASSVFTRVGACNIARSELDRGRTRL